MHLGNLRAALFNFLYAKKHGGQFLLRIEDTDRSRSADNFTQSLLQDLSWVGLAHDDGPFYQSQRGQVYDSYYQKLIAKDLVYPCFCSDQELNLMRKTQLNAGQPPRYSGKCRRLTEKEREEKLATGLKPTLRFKIPAGREIVFHDLVKGEQRVTSDSIGDFIIRRADGSASFMFCNALDDALMGVTHAFRGEDHLANTPRQLLLLEALELTPPQYGHLSLIVGDDGAPLSKRHGSASLQDLQAQDFLPRAVVNYLARVGHQYQENQLYTLEDLGQLLDETKLACSASHFDTAQLNFWQKRAMEALSPEQAKSWLQCPSIIPDSKWDLFCEHIVHAAASKSEVLRWAANLWGNSPYEREVSIQLAEVNHKYWLVAHKEVFNMPELDKDSLFAKLRAELGLKGRALFLPLRLALSGEAHGPCPGVLLQLLGKERVLEKLTCLKSSS